MLARANGGREFSGGGADETRRGLRDQRRRAGIWVAEVGILAGMATQFPALDGSAPVSQQFDQAPEFGIDASKRYTATMETSMGTMVIALDAINAPGTVNNFVFLAAHHYYDGVVFHRIIKGFMCQGGDPTGTGRGGPGYQFDDETAGNPNKHERGVISMANAGPGTNGSQFFITHVPCDWLNSTQWARRGGRHSAGRFDYFGDDYRGVVTSPRQLESDGRGQRPRPLTTPISGSV